MIATSGKFRAEQRRVARGAHAERALLALPARHARARVNPGRETSRRSDSPGTQVANLEVSALPPINLDGRLEYLIHYPYGCLEQTTSSVFPQLYLPALIKLDQNRRLEVENNIRAGLARLRSLQHPSGGFAYWPGIWNIDGDRDWRNNWGTTYAGHFFLEAEKAGYTLPGDMKSSWLRYQKDAAQQWNPRQGEPGKYAPDLVHAERYAQAYRLYTLALAGHAGDRRDEPPARKRVAVAAPNAGCWPRPITSPASPTWPGRWSRQDRLQAFVFADANPYTFGSLLRDRAVVLMGLTLLGREAETGPLLEDVAAQLSDGSWYSTQSVAFALVAVAQNTGTKPFTGFSFDYAVWRRAQAVRQGRGAGGQHQTTAAARERSAARRSPTPRIASCTPRSACARFRAAARRTPRPTA